MADTSFMRWALRNFYTKTELATGELDNLYFAKTAHIASSSGSGDAGKPIKLNAGGHVDATMIAGGSLQTHAALTTAHGVSGAVVGTEGAQTLSDKILQEPSFTGVSTADGGIRNRQEGATRYRSNYYVSTGTVFMDAYDDQDTEPIPIYMAALNLTVATGSSLNKYFIIDADGDVSIVGTLTVTGAITSTNTPIATITGTETLTNKTLTSPTINTPTIGTNMVAPLIYGSTLGNGDLTLEGTSHSTKTSSTVYLQPTAGTVGVGFSSDPGQPFAVRKNNSAVYISPYNGAVDEGLIFAYNPATPADIPMVVQGSYIRLSSLANNHFQFIGTFTPTGTADTAGNLGDVAWDTNYHYRKTASGWKRTALSTW